MDNKKSNYNIFEKLKLNSWEVEILIVGFLLIVLLQLPEALSNKLAITRMNIDITDSFGKAISIMSIYLTLLFSTKIIIITLSTYILLRSFWVGLLGLSSVFPNGINAKNLNYNKYLISKIKNYSLNKSINQLDKLSSTIFSFAFLITLSTISLLMICLILIIIFVFIDYLGFLSDNVEDIIAFSYLSIAGIYIIDYLSYGVIKKIKWKPIAYIYSYIYDFFNYVTLGFIYNSLYYTYISNIKARYIIPPIVIILTLMLFNNSNDLIDFKHGKASTKYVTSYKLYENERSKEPISFPFIQSRIVNESFINLHIPYLANINHGLKNICPDIGKNFNYLHLHKKSNLDSTMFIQSKALDCINSYYSISIDTIMIKSDFIYKTYSKEYSTFNMIIPLDSFNKGNHSIHITSPDTSITNDSYQLIYGIPFYFNK